MRRTFGPLVSVVIPCYAQAHYLGDAIDSVLKQTYSPVEVVVVDDGSPDDVGEVAARYSDVRLVTQSNGGLSAARNVGVSAAQGDYLVFLDADDLLAPAGIAAGMRALLDRDEAALAFGRHDRFSADGSPVLSTYPVLEGDAYEALLRGNVIGGIASAVMRREIFDDVGGFDPEIAAAEDYDLYLRIATKHPLIQHDELVAHVRRHHHGMHRDFARMLKWTLRVLHRHRPPETASPKLHAAYRHGRVIWRETYGHRLAWKILSDLRSVRTWPAAVRAAWLLARLDPNIVFRALRRGR